MRAAPFRDRRQAGQQLGGYLAQSGLDLKENAIVLGLARGGVPVAAEVAAELRLPLDALVVRKLGFPGYSELAIGAVAGGRIQVLDKELIARRQIASSEIEAIAAAAIAEATWRETYYRGERPAHNFENWTVILVDDGLATGSSMLAAAQYVNSLRPKKTIAAAPVGAREACVRVKLLMGDCFCLCMPAGFQAVSEWYLNFTQVTDEEVRAILKAQDRHAGQ